MKFSNTILATVNNSNVKVKCCCELKVLPILPESYQLGIVVVHSCVNRIHIKVNCGKALSYTAPIHCDLY